MSDLHLRVQMAAVQAHQHNGVVTAQLRHLTDIHHSHTQHNADGIRQQQQSAQSHVSTIAVTDSDVLPLWKTVRLMKGLSTDADVARFLLSVYFNPKLQGEESSSMCVNCSTPLTLCCVTCLTLSGQPPPALSSASSPPPPPSLQQTCFTDDSQELNGGHPQPNISSSIDREEAECQDDTDCNNSTQCEDAKDSDSVTDEVVCEESAFSPPTNKKLCSSARIHVTLPALDHAHTSKQAPGRKRKTRLPAKLPKMKRRGARSSARILGIDSAADSGSATSHTESSSPSNHLREGASRSSPSPSYHLLEKYPICDGKHFKDGRIPPFKHFTEYRCSKCSKTFHYKESLKRHMKRPDCDFTGEVIPSWGLKKLHAMQKPDEKESDEDVTPSDGEDASRRNHANYSDGDGNDTELPRSKQKYRFHPVKECTMEEFMTGKIQIVTGSSGGTDSAKISSYSHHYCEECHKVFVSEQEYKSHRLEHSKEVDEALQPNSKPVENRPDSQSLEILTEIKERLLLCCPLCSQVFTNSKEHMAHVSSHNYTVDSDGNHVCNFCGDSYRKLISITTHQSIRKNMRICKNCGFHFRSHCQIKDHMKMHSQGAKCETCGESFDCLSKLEIRQHLKTHKEKPVSLCPICGKAIAKPGLTSHMLIHNEKRPFTCAVCNKSFKHRVALENHGKIHKKTFQCETCGAYFSHSTSLRAHIDFKHLGKFVECQECGKKLSRNMTLLKHIRLVHRKIKPFTCSACGFTCADRKQLNEHVRIHTGEKPYQCQFCPSRFARRDYLKQHIRTHTGEKPYVCEDCGQRFICRTSLTLHRKNRHSDKTFPCSVCGQEFPLQSSLDYHCFNEHGGQFPSTLDSVLPAHNTSLQKEQGSSMAALAQYTSTVTEGYDGEL